MQLRTVLLLILLAVMPLVSYWSTLNNYFLNSDFPQILYASGALAQPSLFIHEFSDSWLGSHDFELYFRPLPLFLLALNLLISGVNPFGYHLMSLMLHILCVWSVFYFTRELIPWVVSRETRANAAAFWAAAFFALYPVNAEVVNWVGARPDCGAGLFAVVALFLWIKEQTTGDWKFGVGAMVSYLVALLFKETAVGIVLLPLFLCLFRADNVKENSSASATPELNVPSTSESGGSPTSQLNASLKPGRRWSQILSSGWKLLAALVIYVLMRWHALGTIFGGYKGTEWKLLATSEYLNRWSDAAFLHKLFFPFNIALPLAAPVHIVLTVLYVLVLLLAFSDVGVLKPRLKLVGFCLVWWIIAIAPEWRTAMMTHALAGGRSFYFSAIPLCIALAAILIPLSPVSLWRRVVSYLVAGAILLTFGLTDIFNNQVWNEAASTTRSFQQQLAKLVEQTPDNLKVLLLNPPLSIDGHYGLNQALVAVTMSPPFLSKDYSNRVLCLDREHYGIRDASLINATVLRQALLASPTVAKWDPELKTFDVIEMIPDTMQVSEHNVIVTAQKSDYPGCSSFRLHIDPAINPLSCEAIEVEFSSEGTAKPGFAILSWNENWKRLPTDIYKREIKCDVNGDAKPHVYRFSVAEQIGWYSHKKIEELDLKIYNVNRIQNVSARLATDAYYVPRLRPDMRFFTRTDAGIVPGVKGAVFVCDTEVDGATSVVLELSQRNECFETYSKTYRDTVVSPEASKSWIVKGTTASFEIPLTGMGPGFWCVRAASLDSSRRITGAFSDPVVFRIEDR
ncbi:MAG: hypothetical protein SGJ27_01700 [Candidatus Melainabacteria bacterium]|nr:hypothetical protein [Candidatus Melainabacteria bacterium]